MREYLIRASSLTATYTAGRFVAETRAEAIEMAKEEYRRSAIGRMLKDVNAFRFYEAAEAAADDCR